MTDPTFNHPEERESYDWLIRIISSSHESFHIECCQRLIKLYTDKYNNPTVPARLWDRLREVAHLHGCQVRYE